MTLKRVELRGRGRRVAANYITAPGTMLSQRNSQGVAAFTYAPTPGDNTWVTSSVHTLPTLSTSFADYRQVGYTGVAMVAILDPDAANRATIDGFQFRLAYLDAGGTPLSTGAVYTLNAAAGAHQFTYSFALVLDSSVSTSVVSVALQTNAANITTAKQPTIQYTALFHPRNNRT